MSFGHQALRSGVLGIAMGLALAGAKEASAQATWDMAVAWPDGNYHTQSHYRFADAVREATDGAVDIVVHAGGALGLRGPEKLGAVRDGIVPIADVLLNQQVGEEPFLGLESVPYLAPSFDDLAVLQEIARPHYDEIAERHNQKILYMVPWPGQAVYTRHEVVTIDDLQGVKIRTVDVQGSRFFAALGASPVQMPWGEVVPSLAAGTIDAVTTSSTSGVDGNFWEFLGYMNRFNWQGSSNMVSVNLDAWNAIEPEHQDAILRLAEDMEPEFWQRARDEDERALQLLADHGITITDPTPELVEQLLEAARPMWDEFISEVGATGEDVINEYLEATDRK
jgi:TRAP-type transport system periplasmic protein